MTALYVVLALPLLVWLLFVMIGVALHIITNWTVSTAVVVLCLLVFLFPGLLVLAAAAVLCFGGSILLKHAAGVR